MELCLIGNPENRRVRDFQLAAQALGGERPHCISWTDLLRDSSAAHAYLASVEIVRLDSPGENDEVLHRLIRWGGGEGELAFGQIGFLREQYAGFCQLLDGLSATRTATAASFQNAPDDIRVMFDKWQSHERFLAADLHRPRTDLAPDNLPAFHLFRTAFGSASAGRIFLKPRFASSASGVCAYRWAQGKEQLIAPVEIQRQGGTVRLFNSLRVRSYTSYEEVNVILETLLPQGMIAEQWIRKAQLPAGQFDLRVLVIAGEARHTVVRQSRHPMTNLHLGNQRGCLREVEAAFGSEVIEESFRMAEKAAACFPDSLYAGVDMIIPAKGTPSVCEINAFGDLLPGVLDRDETAYEAIYKASHGISHSV